MLKCCIQPFSKNNQQRFWSPPRRTLQHKYKKLGFYNEVHTLYFLLNVISMELESPQNCLFCWKSNSIALTPSNLFVNEGIGLVDKQPGEERTNILPVRPPLVTQCGKYERYNSSWRFLRGNTPVCGKL